MDTIINNGCIGILSAACVYPIDVIKTNRQVMNNSSIKHLLINDIKKRSFHKGLSLQLLYTFPEKTCKMTSYIYIKNKLKNRYEKNKVELISGGLAGIFQSLISSPMELLKNKYQITGKNNLRKMININTLKCGLHMCIIRDFTFGSLYFYTCNTEKIQYETFYHKTFMYLIYGAIISFITTPLDVIKTNIQNNNTKIIDECKNIYYAKNNKKIINFFNGGFYRVSKLSIQYTIIITLLQLLHLQ